MENRDGEITECLELSKYRVRVWFGIAVKFFPKFINFLKEGINDNGSKQPHLTEISALK